MPAAITGAVVTWIFGQDWRVAIAESGVRQIDVGVNQDHHQQEQLEDQEHPFSA